MFSAKNWFSVLVELVSYGILPNALTREENRACPAHRVFIYGPPSTGKSAAAYHLWPEVADKIERVALETIEPLDLTQGQTELVNGSTVASNGFGTRAMAGGYPLILDEIDKRRLDADSALHCLLDDWDIAQITRTDGHKVRPVNGYCVIATSNVPLSALPEALQSRFDIVLDAFEPAPGIIESLAHIPGAGNYVSRLFSDARSAAGVGYRPKPDCRTFKRLARFVDAGLSLEDAAQVIFGDDYSTDILACLATSTVA